MSTLCNPWYSFVASIRVLIYCRNKVGGRVFCDLYKGHKVRTKGLNLYSKDRFHLLIHKYYCKYDFTHTYLSHYILSESFGSLLSKIVHLLLQINGHKNMHTALLCVVCPLPVFTM